MPAHLPRSQILRLPEISDILMVSVEYHWFRGGNQIWSPRLERVNDGQQLQVIDLVVLFSAYQGLRQVCTRVGYTHIIRLQKHSASP